MRLISQDGTYDFPYEHVIVYRNETSVVCGIMPDIREKILLGKYSTKAKSIKAMEMLREQYMKFGMIKILASGTCEYMDKSLEKEEKMGIYADYCRKHCFKFPADEEVEV